ncbi:Nonspecific lipid-transfer protein [Geobacillus sp. WSUCF1]|nr:SCP2 sterol-binding domain-containing protein [Geobacillus sp. WSUCF1]EPR29150.1 Nonspecific lipid-transfer protein [Geobacillus sp. WSUCF1]
MPSVKEVFQMIDQQLKEDISRAEGIVAVYQFNLSGDEAGVYQVVLRPDAGFVIEGEQEPSDCTLSMDSEDFKKNGGRGIERNGGVYERAASH